MQTSSLIDLRRLFRTVALLRCMHLTTLSDLSLQSVIGRLHECTEAEISAADHHYPSFTSSLRALINQTMSNRLWRNRILMTMLLDSFCRPVPDGISPFSKGCTTNLFNFCCASTSNVPVYELPSLDELRARSLTSSWWENDYYSCC